MFLVKTFDNTKGDLMIEVKGDAVEMLKAGEIDILFHQVNCRGVMGSGIARQIRDTFPEHYIDYKTFVDVTKDTHGSTDHCLGSFVKTKISDGRYVVGVFSQNNYAKNGEKGVFTNYHAISSAFSDFFNKNDCRDVKIAIPKRYGSALGGGDWNTVVKIFKELEVNHDVEFTVVDFQQ